MLQSPDNSPHQVDDLLHTCTAYRHNSLHPISLASRHPRPIVRAARAHKAGGRRRMAAPQETRRSRPRTRYAATKFRCILGPRRILVGVSYHTTRRVTNRPVDPFVTADPSYAISATTGSVIVQQFHYSGMREFLHQYDGYHGVPYLPAVFTAFANFIHVH